MSGFDSNRFVNLSKSLESDLTCSICFNIFNNAVLLNECVHTFCKSCVEGLIQKNCPVCRTPFTTRKRRIRINTNLVSNFVFKPNLMANNIINKLEVKCDYQSNGCQEMIELGLLSTHLLECEHRLCKTCGFTVGKDVEHNCFELMKTDRNQLKAKLNEITDKNSLLEEKMRINEKEWNKKFNEMKDKNKRLENEEIDKMRTTYTEFNQNSNKLKAKLSVLVLENKELLQKLNESNEKLSEKMSKQINKLRTDTPIRSEQRLLYLFSTPQTSSPLLSNVSLQRADPLPIMCKQSVPSSMPSTSQEMSSQQYCQQRVTTLNQLNVSQTGFGSVHTTIGSPQPIKEQRKRIWTGIIQYHGGPVKPGPLSAHSLNCEISCLMANGVPLINADKWPDKMVVSLMSKQLFMSVLPKFENNGYRIVLHFPLNTPRLGRLTQIMSSNWVGGIQFTSDNIQTIIIIFYLPNKRMYLGYVPHDQAQFANTMKQIIETYKKRSVEQSG